jgi:hypothetical protein
MQYRVATSKTSVTSHTNLPYQNFNSVYWNQLLCTKLCILNHILIFTLTHFWVHWFHLQGVQSYCSFFAKHPNGGFISATSEWLKARCICLLNEHNLKLTDALFKRVYHCLVHICVHILVSTEVLYTTY